MRLRDTSAAPGATRPTRPAGTADPGTFLDAFLAGLSGGLTVAPRHRRGGRR